MPVQVEVWGDYAAFNRPELRVERVSYEVPTPSAARGILDAIYFHSGLKWCVDRIHVLKPIAFASIRRNEVKSKISVKNVRGVMKGGGTPLFISTADDIQQRAALVLRDVRYVIEAHFELVPEKMAPEDHEGKFCNIMRRRLERGQCYHTPYLGVREFPAHFRRWEGGPIVTAYPDEDKNLGLMLYDMDYSDPENITPMFFRAELKKGVLDLRDCEVLR